MSSISSTFGPYNALVNLQRTESRQASAFERVSSGERISSSKDAPADYATANQLRGEIKALRTLRQTSFDGINVIQIADSTLSEVGNLITRAMELAEWSASEISGPDNGQAKQARDGEYQEILASLDQLNDHTRLNNRQLFGAAGTSMVINLSPDLDNPASEQLTVATQPFSTVALALAGTDVLTSAGADAVLAQLRPALEAVTSQQAGLGVMHNRLERHITQINDQIDDHSAQESRIRDMDTASEAVNLSKLQILTQSNVAAISQANLTAQSVYQLLS